MTERSFPSVVSRLLFRWIIPLIRRSSSEHIDENSLPEIPARVSIERDSARLVKAIDRYRAGRGTPLIRPVFRAFRGPILLCVFLSVVTLCASLLSPLLLREMLRGLSGEATPLWFSAALSDWLPEVPRYAYPLACSAAMGFNS